MINFTFTIKNAEGYDKEYEYSAYLLAEGRREKIPAADGAIAVKNGEEASVSGSYIFTRNYAKAALFVELPESGRKIHFILKNEA